VPDPARLQDLRRQRELVAEQLAWLDREIAAAGGSTTPPATASVPISPWPSYPAESPVPAPQPALRLVTPAPRPLAPFAPAPVVPSSPAALAEADELLEQYRVPPETLKTDVRAGCFLYFFGAFALVGLGIAVFYFLNHHD